MNIFKKIFPKIFEPWEVRNTNNPIYVDYYSHEGCSCYKIDLPWTSYKKDTMVLCPTKDGYKKAQSIARKVIREHLELAMSNGLQNK